MPGKLIVRADGEGKMRKQSFRRRTRNIFLAAAVVAGISFTPALTQSATAQQFDSSQQWMKSFTDPKWSSAWAGAPDISTAMNFMGLMSNPKMMQAMMQMADAELMSAWMEAATNPHLMNAS